MLRGVHQVNTNTEWFYLYVESKKIKLSNREQIGSCQKQRLRVGEKSEGGQKVQTSSISFVNVIYSMVNTVKNTILYIWKLLRVSLTSFHHKKNL